MTLSNNQYRSYLDSLSILEAQKLELQKRTIDFVAPGEQQPEVDHSMDKQNSNSGNTMNEFWRDARNGGYFSYKLGTNSETHLSLMVRFWGAERGNKSLDIYLDDAKLVSETLNDKWKMNVFQNVEYVIPENMVSGKESIRVKFQSNTGSSTGDVYYVRLVRRVNVK